MNRATIGRTLKRCLSVNNRSTFHGKRKRIDSKLCQVDTGTIMSANISVREKSSENYVERLPSPDKSPNDKREYRVIKLINGLTALLISAQAFEGDHEDEEDEYDEENSAHGSNSDQDETEEEEESENEDTSEDGSDDGDKGHSETSDIAKGQKLAAAGLCIRVGSFSDPDDIPGLAHFLEHMVFMGSEKYPTENAFDSFIQRHGGSDNASTDCETTVFHFEVHRKYFYEALDRFAQFFIAPLMKKDCVDREIESVDSEFQMSLPSDTFRQQQLFGSFASNGHPMKKFMWGNVPTLKTQPAEKNIDVHARLFEFWKRHYSAHYMTLAVQSQEQLDVLQEWVAEIFSKIPNNNLSPPNFAHLNKPFDTPAFSKLYKMIPVKNSDKVHISWSLPSMLCHYQVKPLEYLWFLIGHEGKGSILSYLKQKVWALNLYTESSQTGFELNSCYSLFGLTIELTEEGLNHVFEVITAVFSYIEMLHQVGPQERIYKEIQVIAANEFRWQEEISAADYVEAICHNMQFYPPPDYITGDELLFHYDEQLIEDCQKFLIPSRANIMIASKKFEKDRICNKFETWYQTAYCESDTDPSWLTAWKNLDPNPVFHLPDVNKYIANDFNIKEPDLPLTDTPIAILNDAQSQLWYKKDTKFQVPKAFVNFHLISPIANSSPQSAVMLDLFVQVLGQNIKEDVYAADVAMLYYSIYNDETGLILKVHGLNQKLPILFETILDHIANFDVTDALFDAVKTHLSETYYNDFIKPSKLCRDVRMSILQQVHWTTVDKRAVVSSITKDMLLAFVKEFKSHLFIEGLVQGNVTSVEALDFDQKVKRKLKCMEVPWNLLPEVRVMSLPEGKYYCRVSSFNQEDGNSVVTNYYQSGPANIYKMCLMDLLIVFMEEPCFDFLRTQEQLGYNVSCMCRNTFGILGFSVTVHTQADKYSCSQVDEKIEEFLKNFKNRLNKISEKEFQTQVTSLIKLKRCVDLHLKEEVDRNWFEILSQNYVFKRLDKEVACLQKLTLEEVQNWFHQHTTDGSNFRKLGLQVVGTGKMHDGMIKSTRKRRSSARSCGHHIEKPVKTLQKSTDDKSGISHSGRAKKADDTKNKNDSSNFQHDNEKDVECMKGDKGSNSIKYKLHFVPDFGDLPDKECYVNDIRSFKQSLMIFPVIKIID